MHRRAELVELVTLSDGCTEWIFCAARQQPSAAPPDLTMRASLLKFKTLHKNLMDKGAKNLNPFWWQSPGAVSIISSELSKEYFCIIDDFLGASAAESLADEVRKVQQQLKAATVGQGRLHSAADRHRAVFRSDKVEWFTGTEPHWRVMPAYLEMVDHLVSLLRNSSDATGTTGVRKCLQRSRAMVARYAEGARYAKHCDNVCHAGEGSACNGRRLTAILYLNKRWRPKHGGQLLLYPPLATDVATHGDSDDAPPIGSIAPIANRLLLFFADARVPHEVQTSHADRLAITLWFYDIEEVQRAAGGMVSPTTI